MKRLTISLTALSLLLPFSGRSAARTNQTDFEVPAEMRAKWTEMNASTPKQTARENFNENKYGMFIHWGLYSQLGGIWKGQKMEENGTGPNVAEWIHAQQRNSARRIRQACQDL